MCMVHNVYTHNSCTCHFNFTNAWTLIMWCNYRVCSTFRKKLFLFLEDNDVILTKAFGKPMTYIVHPCTCTRMFRYSTSSPICLSKHWSDSYCACAMKREVDHTALPHGWVQGNQLWTHAWSSDWATSGLLWCYQWSLGSLHLVWSSEDVIITKVLIIVNFFTYPDYFPYSSRNQSWFA